MLVRLLAVGRNSTVVFVTSSGALASVSLPWRRGDDADDIDGAEEGGSPNGAIRTLT